MDFQDHSQAIQWRIHLKSHPETVYQFLATDEGRAKFWAESTEERDGKILFRFPDGQTWNATLLEAVSPSLFRVIYFGGNTATFQLLEAPNRETDLLLIDEGVDPRDRCEVTAGWVSVLLALKAAADDGADLRNHDPQRTWEQGYADN